MRSGIRRRWICWFRGYLRNERSNHTLQPTALVHEAYARLIKQEQPDYRSRAHFMGVAAKDSLKARLIEIAILPAA